MLQRDVAPGVHRIEHAFTNFYLVQDGTAITVVDCGFPRSWARLATAMTELGRSPRDIEAIVLTHAHPDHVGFAERARTELGVRVWLHERDVTLSRHPFRYETERSVAGYLSGRDLWRAAAAMGAAGALLTKPIGEVRAFDDEPELDVPGGLVPLLTPGHTHGHTAFYVPGADAVIAGDALATHNPYTGGHGPQIISAAANVDSMQAIASLARIADTNAAVVLPGHGGPWTAGAADAVERARAAGPS
jgi:glyoxylase-like metal-dependent hydrolase (beta-lactamase superfamily II)